MLAGPRAASSAPPFALKIARRNARVTALQKRWDYLRASFDRILNERSADMADLPGGISGLLIREYRGRRGDRVVTRIDPKVIALAAELRERQAAEELGRHT